MSHKVRWGVLGVASIAVRRVIPAMQQGDWSEVTAIASRDGAKAEEAAGRLNIPKAYGSYEDLLADPDIDAIYNPLPNHLHVPWSIRSAEAGKHVLCEKPVGLSAEQTWQLLDARDRCHVKIGEAFMVRSHPQWLRTRELIRGGHIGDLRTVLGFFSYNNRDPRNVRNILAYGGGGLMDIGCYPVTAARFAFGEEPRRVMALVERDPDMHVDRLASAVMDFPSGQAVFTCSTQIVHHQRLQFLGTTGRIEMEIPFNPPPERPARILIDDGSDVTGRGIRSEEFPPCNQYTIQGDVFSRAILEDSAVPVPLEDSVRNMAVLDALFRSGETGNWEIPVAERPGKKMAANERE
jgi:predicted dehydrogenase